MLVHKENWAMLWENLFIPYNANNSRSLISTFVIRCLDSMGRVKRIWYLSPLQAAKVQVSLCIHAVSPEPSLFAHTSSESRGTFRQKARPLASLNGWACAVKIFHDRMLEDTNLLDGAPMIPVIIAISEISTLAICRWTGWFEFTWSHNLQDRFSHDEAPLTLLSHQTRVFSGCYLIMFNMPCYLISFSDGNTVPIWTMLKYCMSRRMTKPTKWPVCPAKTRSAWASAQSDQSLHCPHEETFGL